MPEMPVEYVWALFEAIREYGLFEGRGQEICQYIR